MEPAKLPEKLSDLLELAVRDAQECEKDPRYVLDMGQWHSNGTDGKCHVCLAGTVMARTLGLGPAVYNASPAFFAEDTEMKLRALDALRCGFVPDDDVLPRTMRGVLADLLAPIRREVSCGRAPWDVYLAVAQKLREAGF